MQISNIQYPYSMHTAAGILSYLDEADDQLKVPLVNVSCIMFRELLQEQIYFNRQNVLALSYDSLPTSPLLFFVISRPGRSKNSTV